jgi:phosphocarrier protein FPr
MIGIVLVSHSKKLAIALSELVLQMVGAEFPIAIAAGVGDDYNELGTDAVHISEVLEPFKHGDGAVVLMDLGSAVLSAQTALELLDISPSDPASKLRLCAAPMVEAAVSAAVQSSVGGSLDDVFREAMRALAPKASQLGSANGATNNAANEGNNNSVSTALSSNPNTEKLVEFDVVIANPHGLHARPAATLVQAVSRFLSDVQLSNRTTHRGPSSGRSLTSVSLLQARKGDSIRFSVRGSDADEAAAQLRSLAATGFGEASEPVGLPGTPPGTQPAIQPAALDTKQPQSAAVNPARTVQAIGASDGIAIGPALPLAQVLNAALPAPEDGEPRTPVGASEDELKRLNEALDAVRNEISSSLKTDGTSYDAAHDATAHNPAAEILAAQSLILSDPVLLDAVRSAISKANVSAAQAWREQTVKLARSYAEMEDEYMRARAADVRDIAARVQRALAGESTVAKIQPNPPAILVTGELLPGEALACDPKHVLGVLASAGSATAHAAILMRTLGIPMVVGAGNVVARALAPAAVVAIDGASGEVWIDPTPYELATIRLRQQALTARRAAFESARHEPAISRDGQRIEVLANVANIADAVEARENGAEGVGLLRTEFVYLPHKKMPDENEQAVSLAAVLAELPSGPVVIRTPDVGADKPLPYLPTAPEHNPFLGVRGLRLSFRHPEFFRSNLQAILRAGTSHDLWIMFPMVTSPEEMQRAREFANDAHQALERERVEHRWPVKLGMMVEVPAAAVMARRFAELADFFSIGTNDLTQYVLATERGNAELSALQDTAHPAVLRCIHSICQQAGVHCHVSVCGDAASDPLAAALMIGTGVRSLSVRPNQVAAIKAQVRSFSVAELRAVAEHAMKLDNGAQVRKLAAGLIKN